MPSKPVYLPFAQGSWRLQMGLKSLQTADWIEIDEHFRPELALKTQLLRHRHFDVVASLPGSQAGQQEALHLLLDHLIQRFPSHYDRQQGAIANRLTGEVWHINDFLEHPIDLMGRLVQEDFCVMIPDPLGYVLGAASVCFPSRWRMRDKLGKPMGTIHQRVPRYGETLKRPVDHLFERMRSDASGWRLNWSIVETPELYLEPLKDPQDLNPEVTADNAGDRLWLRVERQTLRRLPQSHTILFGIRTYVHPLHSLEHDPALMRKLAAAIREIPPEMQAYKSLSPIRDAVLIYLDQRASRSQDD